MRVSECTLAAEYYEHYAGELARLYDGRRRRLRVALPCKLGMEFENTETQSRRRCRHWQHWGFTRQCSTYMLQHSIYAAALGAHKARVCNVYRISIISRQRQSAE